MNTEHPETDDLNDYLLQPQRAAFSGVRLHLAGCAECRLQLAALSSLQRYYPSLQTASIDDALQQEIADYIDGSVSGEVALQNIKQDPAALKAALHYASHSAAMNEPARQEKAQSQKTSFARSLVSSLARLFEYRSSVWLSASVSAALVMVLAVLVFPALDSDRSLMDKTVQIVPYQDNPQIHFRPERALPGIGFFSSTEARRQPYGVFQVAYQSAAGSLQLIWPPVDNAQQYTLRLQMISQGRKNTVAQISTELNQAEIKLDTTDMNHRYEWTLSGITHDGKNFITSGGFVISERAGR